MSFQPRPALPRTLEQATDWLLKPNHSTEHRRAEQGVRKRGAERESNNKKKKHKRTQQIHIVRKISKDNKTKHTNTHNQK
jgi:hypothetical protein